VTAQINLGVLDVPYVEGGNTTGDVAEILEAHYGIMQLFAEELHSKELQEGIENALQDRLDNYIMQVPGFEDLSSLFPEGSLSSVEEVFRRMLDQRELDGRAPGVPTEASLRGVNHRLLHPYAKSNPPRVSFVDTGQYQANVRVWITEE
jgi:hypothetical protein